MIDKSSARCSLVLSRLSHNNVTKPSFHFFFFYFTILYWFCHTSTWICSPSWTPLPPASLYHPSGSSQCTSPKDPVLNLDWWFISYVILYMFPWHSSKSSHPLPLPESKKLFYTSVSLWRRKRLPNPVFWPGEFHGQSMGSQRVGNNWRTFTFSFMYFCYWIIICCLCLV